jgi:hypothetical protein
MRALLLLLVIQLAACADPHALTYVPSNAAMWNLNPTQWSQQTQAQAQP